MLKNLGLLIGRSFRDLYRNHGLMDAGALSYYALFSFVPLIFLLAWISSFLPNGSQELEQLLLSKFRTFPWFKELILDRLKIYQEEAATLGWVSGLFIFWASGIFFAALTTSFHRIWPRSPRFARWRFIFPWVAGPVLGFVLISLIILGHFLAYLPLEVPELHLHPVAWTTFGMWALLVILYQILLPRVCPLLPTIILSLVLILAIQGVTFFFTSLVLEFPRYRVIYGTISSTILFLLWLEYAMLLILWGANFLKQWAESHSGKEM